MGKRRDDFLKTMELEEPDRVPMGELIVEPLHVETLMFPTRLWSPEDKPGLKRIELFKENSTTLVKCFDKLGFSFIVANVALHAPADWSAKVLPDGTFIDEWARGTVFDSKCRVWVQMYGTLKSTEDWEKWAETFPDPYAEGRDVDAKVMTELADEYDMAVAGLLREPFATLFEVFPVEIFYRLQLEHPDFIKKAVKAYTDYNCEAIKIYGELGCDLVFSAGDLAHRDGPLLNPKIFNEIYFPELRRQVEAAHKAGIKYVKHTDGDVRLILDGLVDIARVDGVHSLDPSAGVDIGEVKEKYGSKIFLMGNVSVDNLALKSIPEIVEETKECIRKAAPGGGFVLCSSNSWYTHCKIENCLAMVRTGMEYGKYPIKIA